MGSQSQSRSYQRIKCIDTTAKGLPCKAWAVTGEVYCSAHLGLNHGAGAPEKNQNARKHGFYSSSFTIEELLGVSGSMEEGIDLMDEVMLLRVAVLRLGKRMRDGEPGADGKLTVNELARLVSTMSEATRAITRIVKQLENSSDEDSFDDILDELAEELGIDL